MATLTVTVATVNRTANLCAPGARFEEKLRERKRFTCSFVSRNGSWWPERGQPVTVTHSVLGPLFGGYISDVSRRKVAGNSAIFADVTCVSYEGILDRRRAAAYTYVDTAADVIFDQIATDSLIGEGFTTTVEAGPTIDLFDIQEPRPSVRETYDALCERASGGGDIWYWDVDASKVIRFYKQDTYPAPFSITDANPYVLGTSGEFASVSETNQGIVNRVFVYLGQYIRDAETQSFTADGLTRDFDLDYPCGGAPTITVNGVDKLVGIEGVDTGKQWYWTLGSTRISQEPGDTIIAAGAVLAVTYQGLDRRSIGPFDEADSASYEGVLQGDGTGVYEAYLQINTPVSFTTAETMAVAFLARYSAATVTFKAATFTEGLRAGQELTVNLTTLNINLSMLIQSVTMTEQSGGHFLWSFTAISGAARDDWKRAMLGLGPAPIVAGGAGVVGDTGSTADAVYSITNSASTPSLSGDGTTGTPFVLTAQQQVVNVTATTQDVFLLLPSEAAMVGKRITVILSAISTDSVWLRPGGGDNVEGSGSDYEITDPGAITITGIDSGRWSITSQAGTFTAPPAADAPNILSSGTTVSVAYQQYGHDWRFAFQVTIALPTTDPDYARLKRIEANCAALADMIVAPMYAPYSGSSITFLSKAYPLVAGSYTVTFDCSNDDGVRTASPTAKTVTVSAPVLGATQTATDVSASRYKDPADGTGIRTVLSSSPAVTNGQYPLTLTAWRNEAGRGQKWSGWFVQASAGAAVLIGALGSSSQGQIIPPTASDESWTLTWAIGAIDGAAAIPSGAVTTGAFTVTRIAAPGSTDATAAYVDSITYSTGAGGASMFGFPHIYLTLPSGYDTSEKFMFARLTLQTGAGTGGSFVAGGAHPAEVGVGDWVSDFDHADGFERVSGTRQIYCVVPNVWDVPSDGNTTHRFKWYIASRRDDGTGATKVQQSAWSSGVGVSTAGTAAYQDAVVDGSLSRISTSHGLFTGSDGAVQVNTNNISNGVFNGDFENDLVGWNATNGTIATVDTSQVYTGAKSCKIAVSAGLFQPVESDEISVRPLDGYYVDSWVKQIGVTDGYMAIALDWYDSAHAFLSQDFSAIGYSSAASFTRVGISGVVPSGASYLRVQAVIYAASGTGHWYVDNIFLTKTVSVGGPLYLDISNNLNIAIASDFVVMPVAGVNTLSVAAIDLAKSVNFDTTNFHIVGGALVINAIAVDSLIAGNALFAGTATFAYSGGGKLTLNSSGLTIADHNTSPNSTVTLSSLGVTIAKSSNNIQISATAVGITGPSGTLVLSSSGVVITNGANVVTVSSSSISLVNGAHSIVINSSGITISNASISVSTAAGTVTINSISSGVECVSGSNSSHFSAFSLSLNGPFSQSLTLQPGSLSITTGSTSAILSSNAFVHQGLPSSSPGAGTKSFWYDPADGNRVKFAA